MANLIYKVEIGEEMIDENGDVVKEITENLPHHQIIAKWLEEEWNKLSVNDVFYGLEIAKHILCTKMQVHKGFNNKTEALIVVVPENSYRWSENRRKAVWAALDAQMIDGFGEYIDRHPIPYTDNYRLVI